jgi:hypothetical protein
MNLICLLAMLRSKMQTIDLYNQLKKVKTTLQNPKEKLA